MPALSNQRHELFAQALAKGSTADAAYIEAGYRPDAKNAARLTKNDAVRTRLRELQERAAVRTGITVASITESLLRIASKGEDLGDAPGFSVSRASLMDAAKLNGLVIDKSEAQLEARVGIDIDRPPRETRDEWLARKAREAA